ncbi:MAG: tyrosine-type recombinase/integrase, partial [Thermoplasmatales archaeon]
MTKLVDECISKMKDGRSFSLKQIEFVKNYDRNLDMNGLSKATRAARIQRLFQIFGTIGKDFEEITEKDIENFVYKLKDRGVTSYTVENWKCVIRGFFKGTPIESAECLKRGKFKYPKKTSKDLLTEEQVKRIIEATTDTQHKSIIAVLWETGCRPGELCNCNISDFVEIGNKCKIILDGKTGIRERTLLISAKYMKRWIEVHPFRNQSNKPLFISMSHQRFHRRITDWTLSDIVRNASKKAGITKNVTPYTFRHSRATNLAPYMAEMELRHFFGWTKDSTMPGIYIHLSGKHVDDKYENIITGKKSKLEPEPSILLPVECPNCNEPVESTAIYCHKCGYPLKKETVAREMKIAETFQSPYVQKILKINVDEIVNRFWNFRTYVNT